MTRPIPDHHEAISFQPRADDLNGLLHSLHIAEMAYCRSEVTRPWGLDLPYETGVRFHYVAEGGCWTTTAMGSVWLNAGDVALMANGGSHQLADARDSATISVLDAERREVGPDIYRLRAGGGGSKSVIVCCRVVFEEPFPVALIAMMPPMVVVRANEPSGLTIRSVLQLMASEVAYNRQDSVSVMTRLADVVVTHLLREWIEGGGAAPLDGALALCDPHVGYALAAIHRDPGRRWSVATLASLAKTSRSTFAQRFTAVIGVSPVRYLATWRMQIAKRWLSQNRLNVAEVAMRLGYDSEASFARAFKRATGHAPGHYRRNEKLPPSGPAVDDVPVRLDGRRRKPAERP
jgi:AraC-like DNA-binding protein